MIKHVLNKLEDWDRRDFLSFSAKAFLGVGLMPQFIRSTALAGDTPSRRPKAKNVIYLYMAGGMSHIDTFDPKPNSENQGPVESIKTNVDGIRISEYFPSLAKQMDKVALIRSMSSTQGAHAEGNYFMHSSYVRRGTIVHPGLGSWITKMSGLRNNKLPGAVTIGGRSAAGAGGAGFFEARYAPLVIGNPEAGLQNSKIRKGVSEKEFQETLMLTESFDKAFHSKYNHRNVQAYTDMYDDAVKLMKSKDIKAFDLDLESKELRESYGDNPFGQGCLLARRLIEHDVRFVEVGLGGWDTHSNNFETLPEKTAILDQALGALLPDLHRRGMLEETMVVLATEFGRTPEINQNSGRDHSPAAFSCLIAGGGVRGGQVYGKTDEDAKRVVENKVTPPDFNATIAYALGLPLEKEVFSANGRPFTVANKGVPVVDLFG